MALCLSGVGTDGECVALLGLLFLSSLCKEAASLLLTPVVWLLKDGSSSGLAPSVELDSWGVCWGVCWISESSCVFAVVELVSVVVLSLVEELVAEESDWTFVAVVVVVSPDPDSPVLGGIKGGLVPMPTLGGHGNGPMVPGMVPMPGTMGPFPECMNGGGGMNGDTNGNGNLGICAGLKAFC